MEIQFTWRRDDYLSDALSIVHIGLVQQFVGVSCFIMHHTMDSNLQKEKSEDLIYKQYMCSWCLGSGFVGERFEFVTCP